MRDGSRRDRLTRLAVRALVFDVFGTLVARRLGNFEELHSAALTELLAKRSVDLPPVERERLLGAWHQLDAWPDVRTGLDALRRERVVAALSNGHVALLADLARHSDLHELAQRLPSLSAER